MADLEQDVQRKATFVLDLMSFYDMEVQRDTLKERTIDKLGDLATKIGETNHVLDGISDRLDVGLRITGPILSVRTSGVTNSNLETCIGLLESLQARWRLIEEKNRAKEYVLPSEETAVAHSLEQISGLVPYIGLSDLVREQMLSSVSSLQGQIREHFSYRRDVEEKVMATLADLLSILRPEQHIDTLTSEPNRVIETTMLENDQASATSDGSLQSANTRPLDARATCT